MLKNCNKKNKKSKNNKGFTLVELVVVIAILAILVGLLVPQYTKYVDKARKSSDASNLANMVRAVEIAAADPNGKIKPDTITITVSKTADVVVNATDNEIKDENGTKTGNAVDDAIKDTMGTDALSTRLKSTNWTDDEIIATIVIEDDYSFSVSYSDDVTEYIEGSKKTPNP